MHTKSHHYSIIVATALLLLLSLLPLSANAADLITNGTFPSDISGWTPAPSGSGNVQWDGTAGASGAGAGSVQIITDIGRNQQIVGSVSQSLGTINATDAVTLSLHWYKEGGPSGVKGHVMYARIIRPAGDSIDIWSDASEPGVSSSLQGDVVNLNVSSFFNGNGTYTLRLVGDLSGGNDMSGFAQANFDDVILDVVGAANAAPTITGGATTVSPASINRIGANTTTISADFTDTDDPGVGAFNATFKIKDNVETEYTLVNNQPNGGGGLTITDNGGGSYTASYTYDPGDAQTIGLYDLYFEVSDGTDNAIDNYTANADEFTITTQSAPTVVADATTVTPTSVNRIGANTTVISTDFIDVDQPAVGALTVTFKVKDNVEAEYTLVNALTHGTGGLTVVDNGGGSYTASYTWDPGDAQTIGLYDLFFEVTETGGTATDGYILNTDELTITNVVANNAPTVTGGATAVAPGTVNRVGANTTTISTNFIDTDQPGIGAFNVTFKIKDNVEAEYTLVNNQPNGGGGLTITDGGGGNYTATYTYDPGDAQSIGLYDLYFEVTDGTDIAIDNYAANNDELTITQQIAPTIALGAPTPSKGTVNRVGSDIVTISSAFTDVDQPGINAFTITLKIREPNNLTELTLVNALTNGVGGLTITDGGGGSYTASYTYDPGPAQTLGDYDIYFEVNDGTDNAIDGFDNNIDELNIYDAPPNNVPTIVSGATTVSPASINRIGANSTTISTDFNDIDQPAVGAFTVTFKVKDNIETEYTLVNALTHGTGGLTVVDNGGGSYTASYTYDPGDAQTTGLYDLYFEVSDGTDNAIDDYAANNNEFTITTQSAPTVVSDATTVTPSSVNRIGTNTTVISTDFTDVDQPAVGDFTVTLKVKDNIETVYTLVNALTNGIGGLTVVDNGGGSFTASYSWDPGDAQTTGLYDLFFEVTETGGTATDGYIPNTDELTITNVVANNPPTVTAGATTVSPVTVNRYSANTTEISASFTDADLPGIGAFYVTFKIKDNIETEYVLVNNLQNGAGGLTISDDGGGNYTASYTYNPDDAQTEGLYDLYFEISDGIDGAIDDYTANIDELEINEILPPESPVIASDDTRVTSGIVDRLGSNTTTIITDFSDGNKPDLSTFLVTFKIREPDDNTELILVNNLSHGAGGLTVLDLGNGNYRASYTYNPDDAQTLGAYDLYCEVDDGTATANAIDGFVINNNELTISEVIINDPPTMTAGITAVSVSPINKALGESTVITAQFNDTDQPGVSNYNITIKVRQQDNLTENILINDIINGVSGLLITDLGGGDYSIQYTFYIGAQHPVGLYDLYIKVRDGFEEVVDDYSDNPDELEIIEVFPNNLPELDASAPWVTKSPVNRIEGDFTTIVASFTDGDIPGPNAFTISIKIREPNNLTELTLVDNLSNGAPGLVVTEVTPGVGFYRVDYTYDPNDLQTVGLYDLYISVDDGTDIAIDGFDNNIDELEIVETNTNDAPTIIAGASSVSPGSVDRAGGASTTVTVPFSDVDEPGQSAFFVTILLRAEYSSTIYTVSDALQHGQSGMLIADLGGGSYEATISFDPPDNAPLDYYDIFALVNDGELEATDNYADNSNELLLTNGGENISPVVSSDATYATPAGIERIGANLTTLYASFLDVDDPGPLAYNVTFKIRDTNNVAEIVLANDLTNGAGGVTITQDGGGVYTASVSWDPPDAKELGFYDLYFHVREGTDTTFDVFQNNLDELEVIDAVSNVVPAITAGNTFVLPTTVNRIGAGSIMIKTAFTDNDMPGPGAFTVTIKVRDESNTEITVVNAAKHEEQGLRIQHVGGANYEAAVLWDPDVADATGTYDLYASITDNNSSTITDDYVANADELTVTSAALLGDGNLLHRTADASACGGPASACHNLPEHEGQNCYVCHTSHGTANIFLIRETIQTPNSGPKTVLFKTLGIGDPDNDPDPVAGDDNAGSMADDENSVQTEICEVCHTLPTTKYYRNDDSHTARDHNNVKDCTSCHPHDGGFLPSGGGESSGGSSCDCHSATVTALTPSTTSYHHMLTSSNPDYTISSKTCLQCHVDHNIFRDDLNVGFGARAKNLRVDITTSVVQGSAAVLSNSDYQSAGTGGICLSCHTSAQTKAYTPPDGSTSTVPIVKADFDAATGTHNYNAVSSAWSDGSTFNANCVKCHNDANTKSYGDFSAHDNPYGRILNPLGTASPSDPLEENLCFGCHSTTQNPNAGSNQDYFGVKTMSAAALNIQATFGYTYGHPTTTYSGRHSADETAAGFADGNRHAECGDCHSVHGALAGTHDGTNNLVSNALKGAWGVEPTWAVTVPTPTDNANLFSEPTGFTKVDPATKEYQICMKCHSNYTTLPSGSRNLAEELDPKFPSTHGIVEPGDNAFCNSTTMNEPWGTNKVAWCSDCHRSDISTDPEGPHGSNQEHLLVATIVSDKVNGTPLCDVCHKASVYWSGSGTPSDFDDHPSTQGQHVKAPGCFACHMWDYSSTAGLGLPTDDWPGTFDATVPSAPPIKIWIHGQNRKWVYNEQDGSAGSGEPVVNFLNGYIADMEQGANNCWTEACKVHSNKAY